MNVYQSLNKITKYIEENLDSEIDYEKLARMMAINSYTMQRIFSLLTNVSLSEYIRKRRLSMAGYDLYHSKLKVMDVAIKYQYDNAASFSRAFEKFHGIKPSQVSSLSKLKNFPRIVFQEVDTSKEAMEYRIVSYEKKVLYGIFISTNNEKIGKDAPLFFKRIEKKYGKISYAMITYDSERETCKEYWVLYDHKKEGLVEVVLPASKWLVFRIPSTKAKDIQQLSHKFYLEFLPSCKYNLREIPEVEHYHDGVTDFLVPIY